MVRLFLWMNKTTKMAKNKHCNTNIKHGPDITAKFWSVSLNLEKTKKTKKNKLSGEVFVSGPKMFFLGFLELFFFRFLKTKKNLGLFFGSWTDLYKNVKTGLGKEFWESIGLGRGGGYHIYMGVSKIWIPQNGWFIMETQLKWMIWGYHYFWKHPYVHI